MTSLVGQFLVSSLSQDNSGTEQIAETWSGVRLSALLKWLDGMLPEVEPSASALLHQPVDPIVRARDEAIQALCDEHMSACHDSPFCGQWCNLLSPRQTSAIVH